MFSYFLEDALKECKVLYSFSIQLAILILLFGLVLFVLPHTFLVLAIFFNTFS